MATQSSDMLERAEVLSDALQELGYDVQIEPGKYPYTPGLANSIHNEDGEFVTRIYVKVDGRMEIADMPWGVDGAEVRKVLEQRGIGGFLVPGARRYTSKDYELEDGGALEAPDEEDGTIRYRDEYGNIENAWSPGDPDYEEYLSYFQIRSRLAIGSRSARPPVMPKISPETFERALTKSSSRRRR